MNKTEKVFIIIGFLIFLIYLLHYFDLNKLIKNILLLTNKEHFSNNFFRPNKLFKHNGKIYLLDNREILENNINPLIFNSYQDYQKYLLSLEENVKNNLHIIIDKKKENIQDIKESNIPKLKFNFINKKKNSVDRFNKQKKCSDRQTLCSFDTDNNFTKAFNQNHLRKIQNDMSLNEKKNLKNDIEKFNLFNTKNLKKYQNKNCSKRILNDKQCNDIKKVLYKSNKLNKICYEDKEKSSLCKKHKVYSDNLPYIKKDCLNENNIFEKCLLEDFFRENIIPFT